MCHKKDTKVGWARAAYSAKPADLVDIGVTVEDS